LSREVEKIFFAKEPSTFCTKLLFPLRSLISCLLLHRRLFSPFIFPWMTCFRRQFRRKTWTLQSPKFVRFSSTRFRTSDSLRDVEVSSMVMLGVTIIEFSVASDQVTHATGQSFFLSLIEITFRHTCRWLVCRPQMTVSSSPVRYACH
jgi:hypothetical protein